MKKRLAAVASSLRFIPMMNTYGLVPRDCYCLERHHQANAFKFCLMFLVKF